MVAITATSSATPTALLALGKARLEQARREADLAEANAQSLRSQADAAEIDAQKSQENVRNIATRNSRVDTTYTAQLNNSTSEVPKKTQDFLVDMYSATSEKFAAGGNALKTNPNAPPVVNAQGQSTGRIVNVSA
jgi:hypothetical protein